MSDDSANPGCPRCGSSATWVDCDDCGGDGYHEPYEDDPLWYDEEDTLPCHLCGGQGGFLMCMSSPEWCQSHPLPGKESVAR